MPACPPRTRNLNLQLDALDAAGCKRVFRDVGSGSLKRRPRLDACFDYLRAGDTLVVWRLDRLGRGLKHLIESIDGLHAREVGFRSLTEAIDTTTSAGRLQFHIFGALAEFEREIIRERTRAGLVAARARGRLVGVRRRLPRRSSRPPGRCGSASTQCGRSLPHWAAAEPRSTATLRAAIARPARDPSRWAPLEVRMSSRVGRARPGCNPDRERLPRRSFSGGSVRKSSDGSYATGTTGGMRTQCTARPTCSDGWACATARTADECYSRVAIASVSTPNGRSAEVCLCTIP